MTPDQALHVAHTVNRRIGANHCSDSWCESCALRTLAGEVVRLNSEVRGLRRLLSTSEQKTPAAPRCQACGAHVIDGICVNCGG